MEKHNRKRLSLSLDDESLERLGSLCSALGARVSPTGMASMGLAVGLPLIEAMILGRPLPDAWRGRWRPPAETPRGPGGRSPVAVVRSPQAVDDLFDRAQALGYELVDIRGDEPPEPEPPEPEPPEPEVPAADGETNPIKTRLSELLERGVPIEEAYARARGEEEPRAQRSEALEREEPIDPMVCLHGVRWDSAEQCSDCADAVY